VAFFSARRVAFFSARRVAFFSARRVAFFSARRVAFFSARRATLVRQAGPARLARGSTSGRRPPARSVSARGLSAFGAPALRFETRSGPRRSFAPSGTRLPAKFPDNSQLSGNSGERVIVFK
jgi:hypothetical protein